MDRNEFDVVIIGGGPSGATLGALLRRKQALRVAIVEKEKFPREHIGESLVHLVIPVLQDSGALEKVLASDCWIKKFGGIFAWERDRPAVTYFDHLEKMRDGVDRWAFHVDRAEFDKILLDHAESVGAEVIQGVAVQKYRSHGTSGEVELSDGRTLRGRFVVDASGRRTNRSLAGQREHLSEFKNLAVWNHYQNCKPAQDIEEDWNIFAGSTKSPIANFAFEHGWVWYIPVPKIVDGKRVRTHSIGLITDPEYVKTKGSVVDPEAFLEQIRSVPILCDLISDAEPVSDVMQVASNYSMICEKFCNYDEGWIAVGDAAYFVDPLFSSGVTFAIGMAGAAAMLIRGSLDPNIGEQAKREMWADYTHEWRGVAQSFALAIDQWYHAIAEDNPDSIYWRRRSGHSRGLGIRRETFRALVDTAITPDMMEVLTHGTHDLGDLDQGGAFLKTLAQLRSCEPAEDAWVSLGGTKIVPSYTIEAPGFKVAVSPDEATPELRRNITELWRDPVANGELVPCPYDAPVRCHRFVRENKTGGRDGVRFFEERGQGGFALFERLKGKAVPYGRLIEGMDPAKRRLVKQLVVAGLVDVLPAEAPEALMDG